MSNFITATQTWVKNRIQEVRDYFDQTKNEIKNTVQGLIDQELQHYNQVDERFSQLSDNIVTGQLTVEGTTTITGQANIAGPVDCEGVVSRGPIITNSARGIEFEGPHGEKTGLSPKVLTLMNDRGKIAHIFLRGDRLFYDYPYDKIYTYFQGGLGSIMQYLHRGNIPLRSVVDQIQQQPTDGDRLVALENWFNRPDSMRGHPEVNISGFKTNECFPSVGTPFMIPESIYFRTGDNYRIKSLKLLDANGHEIKILRNFADRVGEQAVQRLLINFPYVRSISEDSSPTGMPIRSEAVNLNETDYTVETVPVGVSHIADFEHGYYEITDPDAIFNESLDGGLVPNVVLRLNEFPRDEISIIKFDVDRA